MKSPTPLSKILLGACTLIYCAGPAYARIEGGSGGTSGGNPKPVSTIKFNLEPARAAKMKAAVQILRERLPKSCFPSDYKNAMLTELNRLVESDQLFYFPKSVMLGSDRYEGDYGETRLPNGEYEFFQVGAFTKKVKGAPINFTIDSDSYDVEELAMTFAQDLNDHILQWSNEKDLNAVGAMAMGRTPCVPDDWHAYRVFEMFPERETKFEEKKKLFFAYLAGKMKETGTKTFGSIPDGFVFSKISLTRDGFTFVPEAYSYWDGAHKLRPAKIAQRLEVVFSPFDYLKLQNLADYPDALTGWVRDPQSETVISEFAFHTNGGKTDLNMDPICSSREFSANNSARLELRRSGGQFAKSKPCKLQSNGSANWIEIFRKKEQLCEEHLQLDLLSRTKSVDDLAEQVYCAGGSSGKEPTTEAYARIVGNKSPNQFVAELITINEKSYTNGYGRHLPPGSSLPWFGKNVVAGRLDYLENALAVIRDEKGAPYSVIVLMGGIFQTTEGVELEDDDDDLSYQCFFQGVQAGTCLSHYYDD